MLLRDIEILREGMVFSSHNDVSFMLLKVCNIHKYVGSRIEKPSWTKNITIESRDLWVKIQPPYIKSQMWGDFPTKTELLYKHFGNWQFENIIDLNEDFEFRFVGAL